MTHSAPEVEKQLLLIVQQLLNEAGEENSQRKISLNASLHRHLGIDSLGRAELFLRIEKKFGVQLPDSLMAEAETLDDLAKAILTATPGSKIQFENAEPIVLEESHADASKTKTLIDVLLLHATHSSERPHIYLQDEHGKEEIITNGKLLELSLRIAFQLQQRGLHPGETVAIMQPTNPGFFYTFFGVLLAGCVPVPIYPPLRPHLIEAYAQQEAKILRNAEVRMLITFHEAENLSKLLRAFIPSLKEVVTVKDLLISRDKAVISSGKTTDNALIQYTSGSTNAPKGVLLTHENLLANIRAYGEAIQVTPQDVAVSWVPLYHDMGLIGMWLGSLYHGLPLTLLSPLTFLNRPERWLWAMHYHRGTISGGPNFCYELCVRKADPSLIEGLDLSSWRLAVNGAEAIQPKTLERFTKKFSAYGFKAETFFPVYGLAESSVCVTTPPPNRLPRIDVIDRKILEEEHRAEPIGRTADANYLEFVACGSPIPRHEIRIVDDEQKVLSERNVGHLQFRGPSSLQGYFNNPEATRAIYHDGWWDTGDLAYIADKEVFITGRVKDLIIKAGRNLYPTEIEDLTSQVAGIRQGCVIAFGISDTERGTEKLIVVAETREDKPKNRNDIVEQVTEKIVTALDIAPDHVVLVAPHKIPKTSSGKLQRSACKKMYLEGKLHKHATPIWLQLTKLGLKFSSIQLRDKVAQLGKLIYTIYAALLVGVTLPFAYLSVILFPRHIAAKICKAWARSLYFLVGCPIQIEHKKNLHKNSRVIFALNHASYIDAFLILAILPSDTRCVGKQELWNMPIVRTFVKKLGYLSVDRIDAAKGIEDTKQIESILRAGHPIAIFPEGTFSYAVGLRPFKLGAFKTAVDTQTPICPVSLQGTRAILRGEERLLKPGLIKVFVSEPIEPNGHDWQAITRLKNRVRAEIAEHCGEPTLDLITADVSEIQRKEHFG